MAETKEKESPNKSEKVNEVRRSQIISHHFVSNSITQEEDLESSEIRKTILNKLPCKNLGKLISVNISTDKDQSKIPYDNRREKLWGA